MTSQRGAPPPGSDGGPGGTDVHAVAAAALDEITAAPDATALDGLRARYLGRGDGLLTVFRKQIGAIADAEGRRVMGQVVNAVVARVDEAIEERRAALGAAATRDGTSVALDLTWPPPPLPRGHLHPVTRVFQDVRRIFAQLGYIAVAGPEVEYDRYNFTLVNMPPGHPSRDTQDTFFIDEDRLLRTHTSPVQIRSMLSRGAPQRVIVPGKAFRRDYDATHFPMFFQVEGMCIDEGIALSDLKGTLDFFARSIFGVDRATRLRPHHFEFTEPSVELDVSCAMCGGEGCRLCKGSGWLEILGAGMIHPNVLRNGRVDPARYSGFAFGMGVERIAMLAYGIEDGRLLYENDVRFVSQA
ncbi:MAG TPA: phenylalanine--tRNA ligase subunit alpha [Candidatus Dormibacteraeota bacterium]|nr:phenylalanine--tRNA ligase subunit alpha [Candidatus Dormibacteraeota bacterium]